VIQIVCPKIFGPTLRGRWRLRAYPRETVVAEKLEAMVHLGLANSRMKDFYDLVILSRMFEFDGALLVRAMRATFDRRKTPLPSGLPIALTQAFTADAMKKPNGWRSPASLAPAMSQISPRRWPQS
jgi:hypothetical protein